MREAARGRERELDLLAYQVNEIEAVGPRDGETEELTTEEGRLSHVERLMEQASSAEHALTGEDGIADAAASLASVIEAAAELDPTAVEVAQRARAVAAETSELARDVRAYGEALLPDPERLQEIRERIAALKQLQRKYGPSDADVSAFLAEASERLRTLAGADDRIAELETEVATLTEQTRDRAATVTAGRTAASGALEVSVRAELEELGMPGAAFEVRLVSTEEPGPAGAERVELWFSPSPGQPLRALAKAASGGELSRVMLACRSVLADLDEVGTLVFDEVDAGIGGQAGLAVGRRLARLASGRQVLVVTHLPQIACFADRHLRRDQGRRDRFGGPPRRGRSNRGTLTDAGRARGERERRLPRGRAPRRSRPAPSGDRRSSEGPAPSPEPRSRLPSNHSRDGRDGPGPGKGRTGLQAASAPHDPSTRPGGGQGAGRPSHEGARSPGYSRGTWR